MEPQQSVTIPLTGFTRALSAGIDMNLVMVMIMLRDNISLDEHLTGPKERAYMEALCRKGFVVLLPQNDGYCLTELGQKILDSILSEGTEITPRQIIKDEKETKIEEFDLFWKAFPTTDRIDYQGFKRETTRSLRGNRAKTKEYFEKILSEGVYTTEDLIQAIEYEVLMKKKESVRTKENKLKYIHNSATWLYQRDFEALIEDVRKNRKDGETESGIPMGGVDI